MSTENKIEWIHCNQCLRQTRHDVIAVRVVDESEEVDEGRFSIDWRTTNTILECKGCGAVTLRRRVVSHDLNADDTEFYPPPVSRQSPRWLYDLPDEIESLLKEVYVALHANSRRLALMGARAIVDAFMNVTIGDIGGFQTKLEKLVEDGYLSKRNRETLEAALDAGHAAAHRAHNPSPDDLTLILDIVENLIQPLALKEKIEDLKKNTPKRKVQQGG